METKTRVLRSRVIVSDSDRPLSPEIPFEPVLSSCSATRKAAPSLRSVVCTRKKAVQVSKEVPRVPQKPAPSSKDTVAAEREISSLAEQISTPKKVAAVSFKPSTPVTPVGLKRTLSTQQVTPIKGRDSEINRIKKFIDDHASLRIPGALYISGKPGTGKTASMKEILSGYKGLKYSINCMGIDNPKAVYQELLLEMNALKKTCKTPTKSLGKHLESIAELKRALTNKKGPMRLILLDEIDQLQTKALDVFQEIFLWPTLPDSRVILIGISNVLDFVNSLIMKLKFPNHFKPDTLHFPPYTIGQIKAIIADRLEEASDKDTLGFDQVALELCARKIAATTGDIRTALSVCQRGISFAEQQHKKVRLNPESPVQPEVIATNSPSKIAVKSTHIQMVLSEHMTAKDVSILPLQQRVLICCAVLFVRRKKPITFGLLTDEYRKICPAYGLPAMSPADVAGLCEMLAASGVFTIRKGKWLRDSKVVFMLSEEDAEFHFAGKALLGSIINSYLD